MLENSLKDNGCKARDRRNPWWIAEHFLNADHVPRPSQRCFRLKPRIVRGCPGRIRQCWGFFRYPL